MERDLSQFIAAVRRIPLFQGLRPNQAVSLLKACDRRAVEARTVLCKFGDPSHDMFILLSGQLSIRTKDGVQVALIDPIAPVGEMGIFTGEPRSATVLAKEACNLFVLGRAHLEALLRRNPDIELAIARNLIRTLAQRIRDANKEIAYLNGLFSDQEEGEEAFKKKVEEEEAERATS